MSAKASRLLKEVPIYLICDTIGWVRKSDIELGHNFVFISFDTDFLKNVRFGEYHKRTKIRTSTVLQAVMSVLLKETRTSGGKP